MYAIFYLTMCLGPSTKHRIGLSYSRALYMCATLVRQFQNCRSSGGTIEGHALKCYILLYSIRVSVCNGRDEKSK